MPNAETPGDRNPIQIQNRSTGMALVYQFPNIPIDFVDQPSYGSPYTKEQERSLRRQRYPVLIITRRYKHALIPLPRYLYYAK